MVTTEEAEPIAESIGTVRFAAMNLLARREHSRLELRQKLQKRFSNSELIRAVLEQLASEKLQSDERFAEAFISTRINRGQGPLRIAMELKQRGLDDEIIDDQLGDIPNERWMDLAETVLNKKYRGPAADHVERARRGRFLQYRGFSLQHIQSLL